MRKAVPHATIVSTIVLLWLATAAARAPQHVLKSPELRVVVDLETGGLAEIHDLCTPDSLQVFGPDDGILAISAGSFRPVRFSIASLDSTSIVLVSSVFESQGATLPLGSTIRYRLTGPRLSVDYSFVAGGYFELVEGLDIDIASSAWDTLAVRNHYSGEEPVDLGLKWKVHYFALNQVYELEDSLRSLSLVFPNPYQSLITVQTMSPHTFELSWNIITAIEPFSAVDPKGPPLASVLTPGLTLHRQVEIIVSHEDEAPPPMEKPVAYFSPFPDGHDQVIAMTFDDIPFGTWTIPTSGHNPADPVQQYLIRLLEDHPRMKMGWVVLPDGILSEEWLMNPDYPPGKWWLAHSPSRMLTRAPADYLQWLRNIERDSVVYGYEDRVRLGNHGYHHTPEMDFSGREFQSYDPIVHDSTFAAICTEYTLLGLSAKSRKWIRFPGFRFTRSTVDALIKYGFVLFDFWGFGGRLPWMLFYSEHGRIWGIGTRWEGDTPSTYENMHDLLAAGKLCHTAGHPHRWFESEAEYDEIHRQFGQAQADFPDLAYMFPDEVGFFADETYDIHDIETEIACDAFLFYFAGSATLGQTIVVEWPDSVQPPHSVAVDGLEITNAQLRGRRLVIPLPSLIDGSHVVKVSAAFADDCNTPPPFSGLVLFQNVPNPFKVATVIAYDLPHAARVTLAVYNVRGERVAVLVDEEQPPDRYWLEWDGRDSSGKAVASGVYFCRLEAGSLIDTRKMTLVR